MKKILLFALTFFSLSLISFSAENNSIRVITYNIRVAIDTGVNVWTNRKEFVASVIKNHGTDIFGVQEALKLQVDDLAKLLPGYGWVGVGRDDGKEAGEYAAIFYDKKRFEVLEDSTFWLSDTPDKPSMGWDAATIRIVTWAKFKDNQTGKIFYYFNTHFDYKGITARMEEANLLNDKVADIVGRTPAIIGGDFNFKSDFSGYQILTGGRRDYLFDTQKLAKIDSSGQNITFNGFGKSLEPGNKIDYIFIKNNIEVFKHQIITDTFDGRYPSDHMPVRVVLEIK